MPTYSKSSSVQLRKNLEELYEQLELMAPEVMAEIRLLEGLLKAREGFSGAIHESAVTPWHAIQSCLDLAGDFTLTKKEIKKQILNGGYKAANRTVAGGLINDSLNHHLKTGRLLVIDQRVGRNSLWKEKKDAKSST